MNSYGCYDESRMQMKSCHHNKTYLSFIKLG